MTLRQRRLMLALLMNIIGWLAFGGFVTWVIAILHAYLCTPVLTGGN